VNTCSHYATCQTTEETTTSRKHSTIRSCSHDFSFDDRFDAGDFTYEDEELEPPPPEDEDVLDGEGQLNHVGDGPSALTQNGVNGIAAQSNQVIASGDVGAANAPGSKAIPNDQRTTTPYMTKYEKARILGTRALQIR
jgi:DNA-directed RNA polymerases I, II, and III subunit RPABC2